MIENIWYISKIQYIYRVLEISYAQHELHSAKKQVHRIRLLQHLPGADVESGVRFKQLYPLVQAGTTCASAPGVVRLPGNAEDSLLELRFDEDYLENGLNRNRLLEYTGLFKSKALSSRIDTLLKAYGL